MHSHARWLYTLIPLQAGRPVLLTHESSIPELYTLQSNAAGPSLRVAHQYFILALEILKVLLFWDTVGGRHSGKADGVRKVAGRP